MKATLARFVCGRGASTVLVGGGIVAAAAALSSNSSATLLALFVVSPLILCAAWWLAGCTEGLGRSLWEGRPPRVLTGPAWASSGAGRVLCEDPRARMFVDRGGLFRRRRFWFAAAGTPAIRLTRAGYRAALELHAGRPCLIARHRDRFYWWYRESFYWTNQGDLSAEQLAEQVTRQQAEAAAATLPPVLQAIRTLRPLARA